MIKVAVVGLGKMGISHLGLVRPIKGVEVTAVCDSTGYILDVLSKYTGIKTYTDYDKMLAEADLDAVIIATPSRFHVPMVTAAMNKGLHVFCEKPFTLSGSDSQMLADLAAEKGLVNQVGYHYRFTGAFREVKRLLDSGVIGKVSHVLAEAYGPVVLKAKGSTWRTRRVEGGGCLYDYAAHPINLLNWYFGMPSSVGGSVLGRIFSRDTDDEVYSTLYFDDGKTAQLSVNWSDESYRKMSTKISIWGTHGRIYADRQEVQLFAREGATLPEGYSPGWNARYTTELTDEVEFYIRGEEYSAQLENFVAAITAKKPDQANDFTSAAQTDRVISMLIADADAGPREDGGQLALHAATQRKRFSFFGR
ncbi:Gfo/Idh/MocA family protein [Sphingomonas sp. 3-13AW]|uniref:Gfo/Idh/MocA family protein n=1 Tax=Sphingomonas sp. 3-13AW TaxID=3050450 RepID=UPI003BB63DFF